MNWRTPLAKAVYRIGGYVLRIKVMRPEYETRVLENAELGRRPVFVQVGRSRQPLRLGVDLTFHWAYRIDPQHWEHWAVDAHDDHVAVVCATCGGRSHCFSCDPDLDED